MSKSSFFTYIRLLPSTWGFAVFPPCLSWLFNLCFLLRQVLIHSKCKNTPISTFLCASTKQIAAESWHVITRNDLWGTEFPTGLWTSEGRTLHSICYTCWYHRTVLETSVCVQTKCKSVLELKWSEKLNVISASHMSKRTWQGMRSLHTVI